jgi:hypothetical protein
MNWPYGLRFFRSMESNITDQQFWRPDSPLAQPHFDDEATLLSARPVVPIKKLSVNTGFARPWVFGFVLAGALFLGASATALYYSRFHASAAQPVSSLETVSSGAQGVASKPAALDEAADAGGSGSSTVDSTTSANLKAQVPDSWTTRPLNTSNAVSAKPVLRRAAVAPGRSSESDYETREERRVAKREAKEQKRANRERRAGKHSDGVLRIRDIFEGPPRP